MLITMDRVSSRGLLGCDAELWQDTSVSEVYTASIFTLPQHYMTLQPRRPRLQTSPPWKP